MVTVSNRLAIVLMMQAAGLLLAACTSSDAEPDPPPPPPVTDTTPPSVPAGVNATPQSPTSVLVSWTASTDTGNGAMGVAGYRVYRDGNPVSIGSSTTTSFTDNAAIANTTYSYSVSAYDAATPPNASLQSGPVSATTPPAAVNDTTPPSVPANVAASGLSATQIRVTWNASTDNASGVAGYRIYRDGGATPIATQTQLVFTDNSVLPQSTHSYTVAAFDGATPSNASAQSAAVMATSLADTMPPAIPANVTAVALGTTSIRVSWSAVADISGVQYRVFRDGGATPVATVSATNYTDINLTANTPYTYTVVAVDGAMNASGVSAPASATTNATPPPPDVTPPTVPANVTAVAQSTTSILVSWMASTDSSGILDYRVFRNGGATPVATVTPPTLSFADSGLTPSTMYSYTVSARDNVATPNESAQSAPVSATTLSPPDTTAPTVPGGVTATALSSTSIRVNWNPSTDASGILEYRIFRGATKVGTTNGTTTTFTELSLVANTMYTYTVSAVDNSPAQNVSAASAAASATTPPIGGGDTTPPTVPANVTAMAQSSTSIRITWSASTDASGISQYVLWRNGVALPNVITTLGFIDSGLTPSTTYTYTVSAIDNSVNLNESAQSAPASATTSAPPDTTPPTVPTNVTATAQSASSILVTWTASTDASGIFGYSVFRDGVALPTVIMTTSFTDTGLGEFTTHSYTIVAVDASPQSNASAASSPAATARTLDVTAPTVPGNVTAVAQSATSILVTWNASTDTGGSGVSGYRVFRDGGATAITTVATPTYTDTLLGEHTTHTYTIRAVDSATPTVNVSNASSPAASATTLDVTAPTVPNGVAATTLSSSSIRVDWTASTDVGGTGVANYRVFRDASQIATVTAPATTYTDNGLAASTMYSYTVRAVDAATPTPNVSGVSASGSATTQASSGQSGLDTRPSNTTCLAGDAPSNNLSISLQNVFPNVHLSAPVKMLQAPGDGSRWFAVEQNGIVKVWNNTANASATNFVNITSRVAQIGTESGFLGMTFHPNWATDRRVYLSYNALNGGQEVSRISEFRSMDNGATLDPNSEVILLTVNQPDDNHKGGDIAFGPDGYLYIGFGDGGGADDFGTGHNAIGNGQFRGTLLGKMLRIAIGAQGAPYTIPADNPFVGGALAVNGSCSGNCPEIYATGFRNPWRWSFDRATGDLWVGDVGQNSWEEVDKVVKGGNYGWRCREGAHAFNGNCGNFGPYTEPIAEYDHGAGFAITGGYVYRGTAIPALVGRYVFNDYSSGTIWTIPNTQAPTLRVTSATGAASAGGVAVGYGEGVDGELYLVDWNGGPIQKIVPGAGGGGRVIPTQLSATGCVNAANPQQPASGLIPFAPNAPFFSDGAVKTRWMALPNGSQFVVEANNDFTFPIGTVMMKNFTLGGQLVETRLFMRHNDGNWAGYTYEWNAAGTDATRVIGGKTVTVNGATWEFPSEAQCLICHTQVAGRTLGPEIGSFNGDILYPFTGRTANQLTTHNTIATLTPALVQPPSALPVIPNPFGVAPLAERARAYLHANCSYCHQPGGPTTVNLDFRYTTSLLGTNACNVPPTAGNLGIANAQRIATGDASRSVVVARVNRLDANAMPPLMRHTIDTAGVQLLSDWINGLASCN